MRSMTKFEIKTDNAIRSINNTIEKLVGIIEKLNDLDNARALQITELKARILELENAKQ